MNWFLVMSATIIANALINWPLFRVILRQLNNHSKYLDAQSKRLDVQSKRFDVHAQWLAMHSKILGIRDETVRTADPN
jgi:hypothetical protein